MEPEFLRNSDAICKILGVKCDNHQRNVISPLVFQFFGVFPIGILGDGIRVPQEFENTNRKSSRLQILLFLFNPIPTRQG